MTERMKDHVRMLDLVEHPCVCGCHLAIVDGAPKSNPERFETYWDPNVEWKYWLLCVGRECIRTYPVPEHMVVSRK